MIKKFFKDSAVYSFGTVITRGIQIVMVPIYTRLLTPSDYGIMDMLMVVAGFANVAVALEIGQGFSRFYSDATTEVDKMEYSSTSLWFVLATYSLFLVVALLFAGDFNSVIISSRSSVLIFQIAMISIWGSGVFTYLRNQLRWYLKPKYFALSSIIYTFVAYSTTIVLMVVFHFRVLGVFWGMIAGYGAGNLASWYFSKSNYRFTFNFAKLKEMLHYSIPLVPGSIGTVLFLYIDRIAIKDLMSLSDVGIFGIAYRFAAIVSLVLAGFQTALIPLIYQNYKKSETPGEIVRIFNYFLIIVLAFVLALSLFSHEALVIFTTPSYYPAGRIIPIISFATLFMSLYIFTVGLAIAKKTKIIATINIIGAVLNTGLNFSLIPVLGIAGASLSTLISGMILFIVNMYFSQKYFFVPYKWLNITAAFLVSMGVIPLAIFLETITALSFLVMVAIKLVILGLAVWIIIRLLIGKQKFRLLLTEIRQITGARFRAVS